VAGERGDDGIDRRMRDEGGRMKNNNVDMYHDMILKLGELLMKSYWGPMYDYLKNRPDLVKSVPGFLIKPERIVFYLGKTHLAIEYFGPERIQELPKDGGNVQFQIFDYSQSDRNFIEQIIGFEYDSTAKLELPIEGVTEGLLFPTNAGFDKLEELNWNFAAQSAVWGFNIDKMVVSKNSFARIVNGLFFDADENGLRTRHIKWLDIVPIFYDDTDPEMDTFGFDFGPYNKMVELDCQYVYPIPEGFEFEKLTRINRFIELVGTKETTEPEITRFLAEEKNKFILTMAFFAKEVRHQLKCVWQSEEKEAIQPDFFVIQPNDFANIVEFKLPYLESETVVGIPNRETFSARINSYISQTRVYKAYFDDPINRRWFEQTYGFKVRDPKRILVIGRRWDFSNDAWKDIVGDFKDVEIMTYDDLVAGVTAQFYM
jgi:Domain of unknown function (DUF4263)